MTHPIPRLRSLIPMLTTDNMAATIAFYRDTLGFKVAATLPDDNPSWCFLRRDDAAIMFTTINAQARERDNHDHPHPHGDDPVHRNDDHHDHQPAQGGVWTLYLYPEDVESEWRRLKERVEVEYPLYDTDYGMREFGFRDPNGYMLSFGADV